MAGAVNCKISPVKAGDGVPASFGRAESVATNPYRVYLGALVSPPLKAQTISGTINFVIGALETNADANFYWRIHVWVFNPHGSSVDGTNFRGTLLNQYEENTTNEWPTTAAGTSLQSDQTMSSLAIENDDMVIIEIGYISRNSHTTSRTGSYYLGSTTTAPPGATPLADLTVGSTSVTTQAGYVNFGSGLDIKDDVPTNIDCASADTAVFAALPVYNTLETELIPTDNVQPTGTGSIANQGLYNPAWYQFTAPTTGTVRFETFPILSETDPPRYTTVTTLYTGSCGALTQVKLANGFNGSGAVFLFNVTAGTVYYYRAASRFNNVLGISLVVAARYVVTPTNNDFANRTVIASLPYHETNDASLATIEGSEQVPTIYSADTIHHSVWYEYTPLTDQIVRFSTEPTPTSAQVIVWTGAALGSLTQIGGAGWENQVDDFFDWSDPVLALTAGVSYKIQVSCHDQLESFSDNRGGSFLTFTVTNITAIASLNYTCAAALPLSSPLLVDFTHGIDGTGSQFDHLMSGQDPLDDNGKPQWFTWTSDVSGLVVWRPQATLDNSVSMAVYSGACGALTQLAERDGAFTVGNTLTWTAVLGTTYHLQIISSGRVEFTAIMVLTGASAPPPADTRTSFIECALGAHMRFQPGQPNGALNGYHLRIQGPNGPLLEVKLSQYSVTFGFETLLEDKWQFLIFLYGMPMTDHGAGFGTLCTAHLLNPWEDPNIGTVDAPGNGPSVNPYRKFVLAIRTATYHHGTGVYDSDGFAFFAVDGAILWSVSDAQIKTNRGSNPTNSTITVYMPIFGDCDNVWVANKASLPDSYSGAEEVPVHPNLLFVDTFDTGINSGPPGTGTGQGGFPTSPKFWGWYNRMNFTADTAPPIYAPTYGVNGSGAMTIRYDIESVFRQMSTAVIRTPGEVTMVNSSPTCCDNTAEPPTSTPGSPPTAAGPVPETLDPTWTSSCVGGGDVPVALNISPSELWDY